jgi:protein-L-isoaspartate O-methyltransferase
MAAQHRCPKACTFWGTSLLFVGLSASNMLLTKPVIGGVSSRNVQDSMRPLLQAVAAASTAGTIPRVHERALRLVPRGLFLSSVPAALSYTNEEVTLSEGCAAIEPPHIDVLILQKLRLSPGQRFLEIGCGSGYMTMLAAYLVGSAGQATGVDTSKEAIATSKRLAGQFLALQRLGPHVAAPRFLHQDGGALIEVGETWHAICVSGHVPAVWIKTLRKLLAPRGRLVASTDGKLRLYEQGGPKGSTSMVIGDYVFPPMALSRRIKRPDAVPSVSRRSGSLGPRAIGKVRPSAKSGGSSAGVEEGLALRVPGRGLLAGGDGGADHSSGGDDDDSAMAEVMREVEMEEMSGLLVSAGDVEICRTPKGRKCRLGEGGFGVVYKALMNGVDEVAVKLVKVRSWTTRTLRCEPCCCVSRHRAPLVLCCYLSERLCMGVTR